MIHEIIVDANGVTVLEKMCSSKEEAAAWRLANQNAVLTIAPKTLDECIAEGYNRLASLGWTRAKLDVLSQLADMFSAPLQLKYTQNKEAVFVMFQAAINNPQTFDASEFEVPFKPEDFGLS